MRTTSTYSHDLARPRRTLQETQASSRQVSKKIKKIKQIQKNERKALWTLAVTSQCRILSQQELTSRSSHRFSNVPGIPTCHSWAQGRGKAGRRHSGAGGMVAAGERCSWPRPVLTFPQKAVGGWWIVLTLLGLSGLHGSVSVGDSWRWWAGGSLGSAWPGSGIRPPRLGRPSSSSVCWHSVQWDCRS